MQLELSRDAIASLMINSLEVYNNECAGLLFGSMTDDKIKCTIATPIQQASRGHYTVSWKSSFEKSIEISQYCILGHNLLGFFHSHDNCPELSNEDIDLFNSNKQYAITLLLNLRSSGNPSTLWNDNNDILTGCVAGKIIEFRAFTKYAGKITTIPVTSRCKDTFNLFFQEFGKDASIILDLEDEEKQMVHHSISKIEYNYDRHDKERRGDHVEKNTQYHIERIKRIINKKTQVERIDKPL